MNRVGHWATVEESGSLLGMQLLLFAYRLGGRWLLYPLLAPVIAFYWAFRPAARAASMQFLARVHATDASAAAPSPGQVLQHFWQFGLALIDKLSIWIDDIRKEDVEIRGGEVFNALLQQQRGAIIMISHLGNSEICQALSAHHPGIRLTVLHHTKHTEKLNRLLQKYAGTNDISLLQVTELNIATAIRLTERISRGEFIAIAADRVPVDNPRAVMQAEFLGAPALFPQGPFALAQALGAPVLFLSCIKVRGCYRITIEMLDGGSASGRAGREAGMAALLQAYVRRLEHYCLTAPLQWFNFYPFWLSAQRVETNPKD